MKTLMARAGELGSGDMEEAGRDEVPKDAEQRKEGRVAKDNLQIGSAS